MRKAKQQFFQSLDPAKPKQFWKVVKALSEGTSVILPLTHEGVTADTSLGKANMLNNYFATCFNNSCNPLNEDQQPLITTPFPVELLCNEEEVHELFSSLDESKANGPDEISAKMLKKHSTLHCSKCYQTVQPSSYSGKDSFSVENVHSGTYTEI